MLFRTILMISVAFIFIISGCKDIELPTDYFESSVPNVKQTQRETPFGDLRNYQYCEILPIFQNGDELVTEVYNTITCNKCPDDKWSQLTEEDLKTELSAADVKLNGPRHWVVNKVSGGLGVQYDKVANFGDIQMKLFAQINGEVTEIEYIENEVKRWNSFLFKKGNQVYKLVNDLGEKYIMQSYSRMIAHDQSMDDLAELDATLNLPEGWSFETEILEEDFELVTEGQAFVIIDNLMNAYQKIID